MADRGEGSRIVAACVHCGSVYAALELPGGAIQPIGSRTGCASCGETEFTPVAQFADGSTEADDD